MTVEEKDILRNKVTVLIPTYNRAHLLKDLLSYYRGLRFPHPIIVADSSPEPIRQANQDIVDACREVLDIRYERYPEDIDPLLKILQGLRQVTSEYVVICADDDFIVPKGIDQCVRFLEQHPDYSVAHGRGLWVSCYTDSAGHRQLRIAPYHFSLSSIKMDDPICRLEVHLSGYRPTFYSVHRTVQLVRNIEITYEAAVGYRLGELLPSCLSVIQGKVKSLDVLYIVRRVISDSAGRTIPSWSVEMASGDYAHRYQRCRECIVRELQKVVAMPIEEAKKVIDGAFEVYVAKIDLGSVRHAWRRDGELVRGVHLDGKLLVAVQSLREIRQWRAVSEMLRNSQSSLYVDFVPIYKHLGRWCKKAECK